MDNPETPAKMDEDKQYIKQTQKAKNTINCLLCDTNAIVEMDSIIFDNVDTLHKAL
jgi:hypothetical protein